MNNLLKKLALVFLKKIEDKSPPLKVDSTDIAKVLRTAIFTGVATALTVLLNGFDFNTLGVGGAVLIPLITAAVELLNKLVKDNS